MLTGTWVAQAAEFAGEALAEVPASRWTIRDDRYVIEGAVGREEGRLVVDWSAEPPHLDLVSESGPNAGRTIVAVFRQRGNLLQLCYGVGPAAPERPAELATTPGVLRLLIRYRRES